MSVDRVMVRRCWRVPVHAPYPISALLLRNSVPMRAITSFLPALAGRAVLRAARAARADDRNSEERSGEYHGEEGAFSVHFHPDHGIQANVIACIEVRS